MFVHRRNGRAYPVVKIWKNGFGAMETVTIGRENGTTSWVSIYEGQLVCPD